MHFSKTLPLDMPMPLLLTDVVSTFVSDTWPPPRPSSTLAPSTLSPSLHSDLQRFADEECGTDLLPVLAASVRHAKPLILHLQHGDRIVTLSVFPREQQFHCGVDVCALGAGETARLRLIHVGPVLAAESRQPEDLPAPHAGLLPTLLWQLALHGARGELLPEIAGPVRYRLGPGVPLRALPMDTWIAPMLRRLRGEPATLDELAPPTLLAQSRAQRLLNAIYLQGRLMITRSLPTQRRPSVVRRLPR
jgi:hypothetical protein